MRGDEYGKKACNKKKNKTNYIDDFSLYSADYCGNHYVLSDVMDVGWVFKRQ